MPKQILDHEFWRKRLQESSARHQALFHCSPGKWQSIEQQHKRILAQHIKPTDSILDAGCGYGRLLGLLPSSWNGDYLGVDLSPEFIEIAKRERPGRRFVLGELLQTLPQLEGTFDWAVCISMRPMITDNLGAEYWNKVERDLLRLCRRILLLEYRIPDSGEIIERSERE